METTINLVKYVTTKEVFLKMKENQKIIALNTKFNKQAYKEAQRNPFPGPADRKAILFNARYHNIAYALVKGKSYSEVEPKVKDGNEPSWGRIEDILSFYGITMEQVNG